MSRLSQMATHHQGRTMFLESNATSQDRPRQAQAEAGQRVLLA